MPSEPDPERPPSRRERPRHLVLSLICGVVAVGMVGASYAAVPFYRAFCQATGFDGATRRGLSQPLGDPLDRSITVRFDTNVRGLPWSFHPEVSHQDVRIGAPAMAWFKVRNDSDQPLTGRASYNVVPEAAGAYFIKTQCFCFSNQTIPSHTEMRFPVIFYVQPGFVKDRDTQTFQEITLSYTFFPAEKPGAQAPTATLSPAQAQKPREALGVGANRAL